MSNVFIDLAMALAGQNASSAYTNQQIAKLTEALIRDLQNVAAGAPVYDITIPSADSWAVNGDMQECEIAVPDLTANDVPFVIVGADGDAVAEACAMSQYCEALDGALRLRAAALPDAPIPARLVALRTVEPEGGA